MPEKDEPRMLKLTQELFGPQDPDTARIREQLTAEQFSTMMQSVVNDFGAYFRGITEDRRRHPREDLASVIANARIGGDYMPDHDATSYYMIVARPRATTPRHPRPPARSGRWRRTRRNSSRSRPIPS